MRSSVRLSPVTFMNGTDLKTVSSASRHQDDYEVRSPGARASQATHEGFGLGVCCSEGSGGEGVKSEDAIIHVVIIVRMVGSSVANWVRSFAQRSYLNDLVLYNPD